MSDVKRSRWAAIGAALAVVLGAGGLTIVHAASAPSSFVSITPVRVLDTRTGVGLTGPFVSPAGRTVQLTGTVSTSAGPAVVVPAGATAVVLNVTAVQPQADGFISVRPDGTAGAPATSSLNFTAGDIVPNSVTVALSAGGAIDVVYDAFGTAGPTTDVLIDVTGFYTTAATGAPGPPGQTGPRGLSAWDTIPSGVTVTGYERWQLMSVADGYYSFQVPFPARAPQPLTSDQVNFSESSGGIPTTGDEDPSCTGTVSSPTAPPGKVCLYLDEAVRASYLEGYRNPELADHGFTVTWVGNHGASSGPMIVGLTWAYTAP